MDLTISSYTKHTEVRLYIRMYLDLEMLIV